MAVLKELLKEIRQDVDFYLKNDPSINSVFDVLISPAFRGLLNYRIYHKLYQKGHTVSPKLLYTRTKLKYNMDIHPKAVLESPIMIDHGFGVVIGETAYVHKNTIIYHGVTLGSRRIEKGKRHPTIGENCILEKYNLKRVVTLAPDRGERYFSEGMFKWKKQFLQLLEM